MVTGFDSSIYRIDRLVILTLRNSCENYFDFDKPDFKIQSMVITRIVCNMA